MEKAMKWVVVAVLLGAVIVILGMFQKGGAMVKPQEAEISYNDAKGQWELPTYEVPRTGQVRFDAGDKMLWMLFPSDLNYVEGSGTFNKTANLLAIAIDRDGYAVIEVPERFPNPEIEQTITYSVMFMKNDGNGKKKWHYAHGKNPPPKIIIPKK